MDDMFIIFVLAALLAALAALAARQTSATRGCCYPLRSAASLARGTRAPLGWLGRSRARIPAAATPSASATAPAARARTDRSHAGSACRPRFRLPSLQLAGLIMTVTFCTLLYANATRYLHSAHRPGYHYARVMFWLQYAENHGVAALVEQAQRPKPRGSAVPMEE